MPVFKHGFLRSEENVFQQFLYTQNVCGKIFSFTMKIFSHTHFVCSFTMKIFSHTHFVCSFTMKIFSHTHFVCIKIAGKTFSSDLRKPCLKTGESLSPPTKLILFNRKSPSTLSKQDEKSYTYKVEKYFAHFNLEKISFTLGIGQVNFLLTLLSAW